MPRIRTGFSFRAAVGKLEDVMSRLKECDYLAAPITDRASTFGYVKWQKLCKKNNLKPVFGIELAVTDDLTAKKAVTDYWTFIAKDSLLPINKLVELATEQFYYESQISFEQAMTAEGVCKIVGYRSPMNLIEPQEDLFIGLAPSCSKGYITLAREAGHQFALCSDNKYARNTDDDRFLYEVVCGREANSQIYDQHIQTLDEWYASIERRCTQDNVQQAYDNFQFILENSKAELRQATLLVPDKPATLLQMCEDGAKRLGVDLNDDVYAARLERELKLIAEKSFEDYFYIIADLCQWSRQRMMVGPARGSSAGSLVCYLLGITTIDPIPYGLIFERFIDLQRNDLPDIDIDFSADRREMAMDYLASKYGQERMARIGSVAMYKPPSALREAGMALQVPKWKCDAVAESLLKRSSGDARALDSLEDTFKAMPAGRELISEYPEMAVAARMEGHPRHASQHAAGVILTDEPVNHYVAIDKRVNAAMCDKKDAEELNLLKIDALGLTQLSVFEYALQLAGLPDDALDDIPMDDNAAFKILNDAKFCGIFQFNGMALQSIVKQFKVTHFDDIVSITALARPGPLASGGAHEWVRRKNGVHEVKYPHDIFEPYLKNTLGIVLYQEQVMQICRDIGDLDWEDVTALRKAMSKSLGVEYFDQYGDKFKAGARRYVTDEKELYDLWTGLCQMGSWTFNLSHSISYGVISYHTLWLKAHYPFEFAAATLSYEGDKDKQIKLLREMVEEGYDYVAIDPEQSSDKWTVGIKDGKRVLVGPFTNVKGIGPKTIEKIKQYRASGQVLPKALRDKLNTAVNTVGSLIPITDAFKRVLPTCENRIRGMAAQSIPIKNIVIKDKDYPVTICCVLSKINPRDENEAINIARRGGKVIEGPDTASLNLQLTDDTDTIFGKIRRQDYQRLGKPIVDRGHTGKHLYIMRGTFKCDSRSSFRIVMIGDVHYIGEVAEEKAVAKAEEKESNQMSLFSVIEKPKATALSLE